jgi:hypothetical protein
MATEEILAVRLGLMASVDELSELRSWKFARRQILELVIYNFFPTKGGVRRLVVLHTGYEPQVQSRRITQVGNKILIKIN